MIRIDAAKTLRNVKLFVPGLSGLLIFAAKDFELMATKADDKGAAGRIRTKAPTTFEGQTLELDATFDVAVGAAAETTAPTANDFLTAAAAQRVDDVKLFLDAGMSPDTPGGAGTPLFGAKTALVWAIMMKNEPMALALIRAHANLQKPDDMGMTPLTWAVENCQPVVVQAMVDAKADVNFRRAGMTMLQEAGACPAAVDILKKAGAK